MPPDPPNGPASPAPPASRAQRPASDYTLPAIPSLCLRFTLTAQHAGPLPAFKGSMLRGAFGHALRRTVCVMGPQQPCASCLLRRQCVYPRLFETFIDGDPPRFLRGLDTAPRPYVFEPFDTSQTCTPGSLLQFDLILLGQAIELHPYAIFAVTQMAEQGLGFRRLPFRLEQVHWQAASPVSAAKAGKEKPEDNPPAPAWRLLYEGASKRLLESPTPRFPGRHAGPMPDRLTLAFVTPTRLKFKNDLTIDFTLRMLVFKMLRRVLELAHFHVPGAQIDWEFHPLLEAAGAVQVVRRDLRWVDWERRSNRQKTEMSMGGFIGELELQGELSPFLDLLRTCAIVHVGKGAVFGNGKMEVRE